MDTKICSVCKIAKSKTEFSKRSGTACGVQSRCKVCNSAYQATRKDYRAAKRLEKRDELRQRSRQYYVENKVRLLGQKKDYYLANREEILQKRKDDYPKTNARISARAKVDPVFNLGRLLKARLSHAARSMSQKLTCGKALRAERDLIRQRIEMNFQPGMSWANYGQWQIDHVKPIAAFAAQGKDLNLANLRCNLRPVWKTENMLKSSTFKGRYYRYRRRD